MMQGDLTALVVDHGLFLPVARRLARDFKKVYYYTPWEKSFPTVRDCIGDGYDNIERVNSIWDAVHKCDLAVFPDIGFSAEQSAIKALDIPVWGSGTADELEVFRGSFLDALLQTDLPIPTYQKITGLNELRSHLKDKENKWIKVSKYRGDWETLHWRNWQQDEPTLDAFAVKLGPWKELFTFFVFDPIETNIEDGDDSYCINGKWPKLLIRGMECKDKAFIGTFQKAVDLPEHLKAVHDAFGPILAQHDYRGFFSMEVRVTEEGQGYFIDPTCRAGSPPSQVQCEMIANYSEIIEAGSRGELVEPEPYAKFGVQSLLTIKPDRKTNWFAVEIPDHLDQWMKCGMCSIIDGRTVFPPNEDADFNEIGWIVGVGDSMEEAITHLQKNIQDLPEGVCCESMPIAELLEEIAEAEEKGMEFTEQPVPPPEIVLKDQP